jgi:hypothetical protein
MGGKAARLISLTERLYGGDPQKLAHGRSMTDSNRLVTLRTDAVSKKPTRKILGTSVAIASIFSPHVTLSSELGYPGSALAEFQRLEPLIATARAPLLDAPPPSAASQPEAKLDEKTIKYTGKCYARLDGRVRINGPCPVTWRTGDDLGVDLDVGENRNEEEVVVSRDGRKWRAHWGQFTDGAGGRSRAKGSKSSAAQQDLGEVRKHGSCWSNSRVRICERES